MCYGVNQRFYTCFRLPHIIPTLLFCRCLDAALQEGLPLEVNLSSGEHHCAVAIAPSGDGRWVCSYTPPAPGFYRLEAASRGVPVAGSPFSVQARFREHLCNTTAWRQEGRSL